MHFYAFVYIFYFIFVYYTKMFSIPFDKRLKLEISKKKIALSSSCDYNMVKNKSWRRASFTSQKNPLAFQLICFTYPLSFL